MQYHWISININYTILGFSGSSVGKERICPWYRRPQFSSWVGKIPWRRDRLPTAGFLGFPHGWAGEESTCNAGDLDSIPGLGRFPGEGKGYPLQFCGLENSIDCIVRGVAKSWTWLSDFNSLSFVKITNTSMAKSTVNFWASSSSTGHSGWLPGLVDSWFSPYATGCSSPVSQLIPHFSDLQHCKCPGVNSWICWSIYTYCPWDLA